MQGFKMNRQVLHQTKDDDKICAYAFISTERAVFVIK